MTTATKKVTRSVAKLERLMSAYDSYNRLDLADDGSPEMGRIVIKAQNRLIDECVECGMTYGGDEFEFAARVTTKFLCAA
jgi:hypothetical protein